MGRHLLASSSEQALRDSEGRRPVLRRRRRSRPRIVGLFEDSKGSLWVGVATGLWRWKPGPPIFHPLAGELNGIQGLAEGDDGALLISTRDGIRRFVDGKTEVVYRLPGFVRQFQALRLLRDRDGGLWIGTFGRGLVHVHQGRTDVFAQSDGLSADDAANSLFEDREGNIWVATSNGLDRFRDFAVARFAVNQGLSIPMGSGARGPGWKHLAGHFRWLEPMGSRTDNDLPRPQRPLSPEGGVARGSPGRTAGGHQQWINKSWVAVAFLG